MKPREIKLLKRLFWTKSCLFHLHTDPFHPLGSFEEEKVFFARSAMYVHIFLGFSGPEQTDIKNLTHFTLLVSFHTPWKHCEMIGFLIFSGGTESDHWYENTHSFHISKSNATETSQFICDSYQLTDFYMIICKF